MCEYELNEHDDIFEAFSVCDKPWWKKLKEDKEIYVDIRKNNEIHAYCNGGRILRIKSPSCAEICHAYLPVVNNEEYASCSLSDDGSIKTDTSKLKKNLDVNLEDLGKKLEQIKSLVKLYNPDNSEKAIQGAYATEWKRDNSEVYGFFLDTEFDFQESENKSRADLIYLYYKDPENPKLYFVELKTKDDERLWNTKISAQLKKYKELISQKRTQLIEYYKKVYRIKYRLGLMPINELTQKINIDNLTLQTRPILLVGDITDDFMKKHTKELKDKIINLNEKVKDCACMSIYRGKDTHTLNFHTVNKNIFRNAAPKIIVHRGTEEIGGNAIEITVGTDRVLFDFGIPLESMDRECFSPEEYSLPLKGLYKGEKPQFKAVFLTHAHSDHFGLLQLVHPDIPIYVTATTLAILKKIAPLTSKFDTSKLNLLPIGDETVHIGGIAVNSYKVDHSIPGSCAFKIDVDGTSIVYTGDIRFHGRCEYKNKNFIKSVKNPDYLIMEGTTLNRAEQNVVKEKDLEEDFVKEFSQDKLPLVLFSPQNLDRLVTIFRACKRSGKTLVLDPYSCYVLEQYAPESDRIPQFDWENIRVQFSKSGITDYLAETDELWKYKHKKIGIDEIRNNPQKFVVKGAYSMNRKVFDKFSSDEINLIFSMWKGYLDKPNKQLDPYKNIIKHLHTSGHAYPEDLISFTQELQPRNIIPVHTECKVRYSEYFDFPVIELADGEVFEC